MACQESSLEELVPALALALGCSQAPPLSPLLLPAPPVSVSWPPAALSECAGRGWSRAPAAFRESLPPPRRADRLFCWRRVAELCSLLLSFCRLLVRLLQRLLLLWLVCLLLRSLLLLVLRHALVGVLVLGRRSCSRTLEGADLFLEGRASSWKAASKRCISCSALLAAAALVCAE